ncbi:protein Wnt-11 isoform X2 [Microcebus murinus]|uniref:protein Wnt-11 isoform X2 n=1 Tax=Microcebus murinus TaxID=30608 RepID=UPI003F6AB246
MSPLCNSTGCEVLWSGGPGRSGSVAPAGTPPPPPACGLSHPVGFRRADVGGSKRPPAPYKAVWAAGAADRAGRRVELRRTGERRTRELSAAQSSPSPRGTRAGRRGPGSPAFLRRSFAKRAPSPLAQPECARPGGNRARRSLGRPGQRARRARGRAPREAACAQDERRWRCRRLDFGAAPPGATPERARRATMRARPQVCEALLFALALQTGVCYGIKWLALSKTPAALALNQTQHCKQLEGLVSAQVQLCRSNLELMHTIVHAAREVTKACRRAFADMRWNCSSIELAPNYLLDLERGTRESAFVYALSAAAISHAIARACTSGDLPGCSCGPVPGEPPGPGNRWGGCADNLSYGLLMGAKFSDAPMKVKKTGSQANKLMRLHNSEVGRQALRASLEMKCKCHGVSGSCSIRTCWKGLQELRDVAADLKTRYLSATKSSPDFCMKNEKVGSHGTQDRQCNKTSNGSDSCDLMCCGRGYNPYTDRVVERCHCKYHWCCYVTCRRCERTVERYVCK